MSNKTKKMVMKKQLSLQFNGNTIEKQQCEMKQNNIIRFDKFHHNNENSISERQKREAIINKLISHAEKLDW